MLRSLKHTHNGFTVIELMITLLVAAILAAIAAPSFSDIIKNNRLTTQINELQASLGITRSEAITRNVSITMCRSSNGTGCSGNWQNGWIAFIDSNFDGNVGGEEVLRVHGRLSVNNTLAFTQATNRVTYAPDGVVRSGPGTFKLCDDRGANSAKAVIVNITGRPRLALDGNGDGIVEDGGGNISCP